MQTPLPGDITVLLEAWRSGDPEALNQLVSATYPRLRKIAVSLLRRGFDDQTIQATGIVHELYLLLRQQRTVSPTNREEFYSFAAYLVRLILMNFARNQSTQKRGAHLHRVPLRDDLAWIDVAGPEMIDLHSALDELARHDRRKARIFDLVAFLGCSMAEAADLTGVSLATAERDLRFAKVWLRNQLQRNDAG